MNTIYFNTKPNINGLISSNSRHKFAITKTLLKDTILLNKRCYQVCLKTGPLPQLFLSRKKKQRKKKRFVAFLSTLQVLITGSFSLKKNIDDATFGFFNFKKAHLKE